MWHIDVWSVFNPFVNFSHFSGSFPLLKVKLQTVRSFRYDLKKNWWLLTTNSTTYAESEQQKPVKATGEAAFVIYVNSWRASWKYYGSMNMDELLNNIGTVEQTQALQKTLHCYFSNITVIKIVFNTSITHYTIGYQNLLYIPPLWS